MHIGEDGGGKSNGLRLIEDAIKKAGGREGMGMGKSGSYVIFVTQMCHFEITQSVYIKGFRHKVSHH